MPPHPQPPSDASTIDAHSSSALATTKRNLRYLYNPTTASAGLVSSRRTRALLRVVRSSLIFAFWRLVRYAKYVAIGSLVATLGAGVVGSVVSGAGFVLAPTGIMGTIMAGSVWGVGKFVLRRVKGRWNARRGRWEGLDDEEEEELEEGFARREVRYAGAEEMPW